LAFAAPGNLGDRQPVACARFWGDPAALPPRLPAEFATLPGVHLHSPGLVTVAAAAGDAAVFDGALCIARAWLREAQPKARFALRALVFPAELEVAEDGWRLIGDRLTEDLDRRAPELPAGSVLVTSFAAHGLERGQRPLPRGEYSGPSGRRVPLARVTLDRARRGPQVRNAEIFGRVTRYVARPALEEALEAAWGAPAMRVVGGLGEGKTRLVAETLRRRGESAIWLDLGSSRTALRTDLVGQLLAQARLLAGPAASRSWAEDEHEWRELLARRDDPRAFAERFALATWKWLRRVERPFRVIVDGMEGASDGERALLRHLGDLPQLGRSLRLNLVGRPGAWEADWPAAVDVAFAPLPPAQAAQLATQLSSGISLPAEIAQRLAAAAAGNPFALEEGLLHLIHRGDLRRVYGNFFYNGDRQAGFAPTARLVRQVRAEAERLAAAAPLRFLAAAQQALPISEAGSVADAGPLWADLAARAGWLLETPTAWGPGVTLRAPFVAAGLLSGATVKSVSDWRIAVGESLAARGAQGERGWDLYRLLVGSPLALPALLAAAQLRPGERPRPELLTAFTDELAALRQRGGSEEGELDLLWHLLPLAHRLESLAKFRPELERALELSRGQGDKVVALSALRAEIEEQSGRFDRAGASLRQALETAVARETDDDRKSLLSIRLGRLLMREERFAESRQLFERILPFLEQGGRANLAASCHFYLGNIALAAHDLEAATAHHQAALETRRRKRGDKALTASLTALGAVSLASGNYPAALAHQREAQAMLDDGARGGDLAYVLLGLGRVLTRLGDFASGSSHLRRAVSLRESAGDPQGEAIARLAYGDTLLQTDQVSNAQREARQAHFLLSMAAESRHLGDAEQLLGRISLRQQQPAEARHHLAAASRIHGARGDRQAAAIDLGWQLEIDLAERDRGAVEEAARVLDAYLEEHRYPEQGEVLDLHLFHALQWLRGDGAAGEEALRYLRRGYRNLLRKTAYLEPGARHGFLFQVPQNRELLAAATRLGLSLPPPD
jgi:tetratricopeptide (TPR) repeat protein